MSECTYTPDTVEDFILLGIQQEHDGNETLEARSVQILWVHTQHTVVSLEGREGGREGRGGEGRGREGRREAGEGR